MSEHDCERTQAEFSALLDNELSDDERRAVLADVKACVACAAALEELRAAVASLSQLKQAAPPTFLEDVQNQIRQRSHGRFFGKRFLLFGRIPFPFEWVSLVMILAMLGYYIITMQSNPTEVTPLP
jgi:anti-sigma factor RsiW